MKIRIRVDSEWQDRIVELCNNSSVEESCCDWEQTIRKV